MPRFPAQQGGKVHSSAVPERRLTTCHTLFLTSYLDHGSLLFWSGKLSYYKDYYYVLDSVSRYYNMQCCLQYQNRKTSPDPPLARHKIQSHPLPAFVFRFHMTLLVAQYAAIIVQYSVLWCSPASYQFETFPSL